MFKAKAKAKDKDFCFVLEDTSRPRPRPRTNISGAYCTIIFHRLVLFTCWLNDFNRSRNE